ncbi:hydroxyacid dehydrogenase [Streptomyces sp. NPDC055709]
MKTLSCPVLGVALRTSILGDVFPPDVVARLAALGEVEPGVVFSDFRSDAKRDLLARTEVLLTGWGCPRLDEEVMALAPRLRAVIHAAGSVRHHVTPAVFEAGIAVSSAADANARPVAEYTLSMLVLAMKGVLGHVRDYRLGRPELAHRAGEKTGLAGATVGIVGASRIGRLVMQMLPDYGTRALVSDPFADRDEVCSYRARLVELDHLCSASDAVSIHAPELPSTHHLFDERRLALMRPGSVLINTARGSLVDTEALVPHCASGRLRAILDVTVPEPLPPGHPLLNCPHVLITPHVAGARGREVRRFGEYAADEVERYVTGRPLLGLVRLPDLDRVA